MIYHDIKQSQNICQPFFNNQLNFNNEEDLLLNHCQIYCTALLHLPNSPWQHHTNIMGYWYSKGQTKISKLQRNILCYLHQWYFSKGKPVYIKSKNLAKKFGSSRRNTIRAITRLIERGILIRLEYWSDKYQRFRSILLPKIYQSFKEKLIFQLKKRTHLFSETDTGGCVRYFFNIPKILNKKFHYIYTNILLTNILLTNKLRYDLTSLNQMGIFKEDAQDVDSITTKQEKDSLMQTKPKLNSKPKRLVLKVKEQTPCPKNISDILIQLENKNYDINSISKIAQSELFYFLENKIFYGYGANNTEIEPIDLQKLFTNQAKNYSQFLKDHDKKLFKILINLYRNHSYVFGDEKINSLVLNTLNYWNGAIKNTKDKTIKFNGVRPTLKTLTGFKCFLGIANLLVNKFNYNKDFIDSYKNIFIRAIKRYLNYSYVLMLPKNVKFELVLIDPSSRKDFEKCVELNDEDFYEMINTSRRVYRERPENAKSMRNLEEIFIDAFYYKNKNTGKVRFEKFRSRFARWLEILIQRIEKYNTKTKTVELYGLKLTAETPNDVPVIYYYFEWLKTNIFASAVFSFDEMFSLENWNSFIKKFMRQERGYSNYWKIVDKN
jgi:hypothetical protein